MSIDALSRLQIDVSVIIVIHAHNVALYMTLHTVDGRYATHKIDIYRL